MRSLKAEITFALLLGASAYANELSYAVCCIDYIVENNAQELRPQVPENEASDEATGQIRSDQRDVLRRILLTIIRQLAEERGYDYVFETEQTRRQLIADDSLSGMSIDFSCPDITEEIVDVLKAEIQAEQD